MMHSLVKSASLPNSNVNWPYSLRRLKDRKGVKGQVTMRGAILKELHIILN
jgi:hypothetical protein